MSGGSKKRKDHYEVLDVPRDADSDAIKKAYRKLVREFHPDVAGDDPMAARRFREVQASYGVLKDPAKRRSYDRRFEPRRPRSGPDGFRMPGGFTFRTAGQSSSPRMSRDRVRSQANQMGLDDLVGDFGFGDGSARASGTAAQRTEARTTSAQEFGRTGEAARRGGQETSSPRASRTGSIGSDIRMSVDVPASVSVQGGSVEVRYPRLQASDDGRSVHRVHEIYFLRVPPGTSSGDSLLCHRWGNAGTGGSCGDLLCDIRVIPEGREASPGGAPRARVEHGRNPAKRHEHRMLSISLSEAVLGGRAEVSIGSSVVIVTIPPLSSGGRRLRLKGRGQGGNDLFLELQIVLPEELDEESRELIAQFALRNPCSPRES
jgi:curved DNA-binding protein